MQSHQLSQLLAQSFANIVTTDSLPPLLHILKDHFGCNSVTVTHVTRGDGLQGYLASDRFAQELTDEYQAAHFGQCPRMRAFFALAPGECTDDRAADAHPAAHAALTPHYRDWLTRAGCDHSIGIKLQGDCDWQRVLTLNYSAAHTIDAQHAFEQARVLAPHLSSYVAVRSVLEEQQQLVRHAAEREGSGRSGLALLGSGGRILHMSGNLLPLVVRGALLSVRRDTLHAATGAAGSVHAVLADVRANRIDAPQKLRHVPAGGQLGFIYHLAPVLDDAPHGRWSDARAILTVTDLDAPMTASLPVLMRSFGLTRREAEVAARLTDGLSTSEIAAEFAISVDTVRQHIKAIFAKTGTGRQYDLTRLVQGLTA